MFLVKNVAFIRLVFSGKRTFNHQHYCWKLGQLVREEVRDNTLVLALITALCRGPPRDGIYKELMVNNLSLRLHKMTTSYVNESGSPQRCFLSWVIRHNYACVRLNLHNLESLH